LKAIFLELRVIASSCYMPTMLGKAIKYPIGDENEDIVLQAATLLKDGLLRDESNFGSQSTIGEQNFIKEINMSFIPKKLLTILGQFRFGKRPAGLVSRAGIHHILGLHFAN
ncbi:hypothetical protein CU097_004274, partial [Rhizopus azygosporus]